MTYCRQQSSGAKYKNLMTVIILLPNNNNNNSSRGNNTNTNNNHSNSNSKSNNDTALKVNLKQESIVCYLYRCFKFTVFVLFNH